MRPNLARRRAIEARLGREMTVWIATVRNDGRPHLTPVWFVWLEDRIYIAIGADSVKFRNMRSNQLVSLALPDTEQVVLLEGEAHVADRRNVDKVANHFYNKYEWDFRYDDEADWRLIEITPSRALAWGDEHGDQGTRVF